MVNACIKDQACSIRAMGCFVDEREFSFCMFACWRFLFGLCVYACTDECVCETACWAGLCILFSLPLAFLQNALLKEWGVGWGAESRMNGSVERPEGWGMPCGLAQNWSLIYMFVQSVAMVFSLTVCTVCKHVYFGRDITYGRKEYLILYIYYYYCHTLRGNAIFFLL